MTTTTIELLAPVIKLAIPNIIKAFESYKRTNEPYDLVFCIIYTSIYSPPIESDLDCIRCNLSKEYRQRLKSIFLNSKAGRVKLNPYFEINCYPININFLKNQRWQFSLTYNIEPNYSLIELENLLLELETL